MKKIFCCLFFIVLVSCSFSKNIDDTSNEAVYFEEIHNQIIFGIKNDLKLAEEDARLYQYDYRFIYKDKAVDCYSNILIPLVSIVDFSLTNENNLVVNYQNYKYTELSVINYDMSKTFNYFELNQNDNWTLKRVNEIYQYKLSELLENNLTVIGILYNEDTSDSIEIILRFREI